MKSLSKLFVAASIAALVPCAEAAVAATSEVQDIHLSYSVQDSLPQAVTDVITFNEYVNDSGEWWPSSLDALGGTITDPFTKSSDNRPLTAFMLGLTTDLPHDADGQQHVVMMMNTDAAKAAESIAWGTLFRHYTEETIAADIAFVAGTTRVAGRDGNSVAWDAALRTLVDFTQSDLKTGIMVGDQSVSGWFSLGDVQPGSTTSTDFTVMAFSDGSIVGSGTAMLEATPHVATPVPEARSSAMMLAGLGLMGLFLRRRGRREGAGGLSLPF